MSEKIRLPLHRDKVIASKEMRYHVAVQICEFNELDVFLAVWPICAAYDAKTLDFPLDTWEQVKSLVDNAIKDFDALPVEEEA